MEIREEEEEHKYSDKMTPKERYIIERETEVQNEKNKEIATKITRRRRERNGEKNRFVDAQSEKYAKDSL